MSSSNFQIIPYKSEYKNELLAILDDLIPTYFAPNEKADYIHYLQHETEWYYVVFSEATNQIVGAGGINFIENKTIARLSWDLIKPNMQGKGIGTFLGNFRINKIRSLSSAAKITVRTSQKTHLFYATLGFELIEVKKDFWAKGFDLYYMELRK